MANRESPVVLRPEFRPFVWMPVLWAALFAVLLLGVVHVVSPFLALPRLVGLVFGGVVLCLGLLVAQRLAAWSKERVEIHRRRIVRRYGGLLTSGSVELDLRNVTQVGTVRPFLESRLFGTGRVELRAAGSFGTEVEILGQREAEEVLELVQLRMAEQGLRIDRGAAVLETRPQVSGIVMDMGPSAVAWLGMLGLVWLQAMVFAGILVGLPDESPVAAWSMMREMAGHGEVPLAGGDLLVSTVRGEDVARLLTAVVVGLVLAFLVVVGGLGVRLGNLLRRRYTLRPERVDFEDGFLTRRLKMIPVENLADVTTHAPLLLRLVSHARVTLSAQGAGSEIVFELVPDAEMFKEVLKGLIEDAPSREGGLAEGGVAAVGVVEGGDGGGTAEPLVACSAGVSGGADGAARPDAGGDSAAWSEEGCRGVEPVTPMPSRAGAESRPVQRREWPEVELRMDARRVVLAPLLWSLGAWGLAGVGSLVVFIVLGMGGWMAETGRVGGTVLAVCLGVGLVTGLFGAVGGAFRRAITTYTLGRRSVRSRVALLQERIEEFGVEKVMTLHVRRDPVDRWMGTATVTLMSVGSMMPLVLSSIRLDEADERSLCERLGMPVSVPRRRLRSRFTVRRHVLGSLWWPLVWGLSLLVGGVLFVLGFGGLALFAAVGGALALWVLFAMAAALAARYRELWLHDEGVTVRSGVFVKGTVRGAWADLRHIDTVVLPGCGGAGWLDLFFGGPGRAQVPMLDGVVALHRSLDAELSGPDASLEEELAEARPLARVALARLALTLLLVFPLLPLLPVVLPLSYLRLRRTRHVLTRAAVVSERRLLWSRRSSVLLERVDHVTVHRGPLHQMLGGGTVRVFTTGSSGADLVVGDVPDAEVFSARVREVSGRDAD